jgi:uncharacterized membrane protein YphA (DoxX/SURF4 family)
MKLLLLIIRWIVGLLFIFSGLVKANDPLGLAYKMQEFFEVWGMHGLQDYTLWFSLLMNTFEVVAGIAVIVGWQMRLFSWLLLLLIVFFTFLTGYAVLSGKIKTCGCFGDCIPLSSEQSFIKDIVLLVFIIFLFIFRNQIQPGLGTKTALKILVFGFVGTIFFQYRNLKYLPVIDCLPYKKGKDILQQMQIPAGAIPDSLALNFVYKKNGKVINFDQAHFPVDFDDTYEYIDRKDVVVKKGNGLVAPIADFSLQTLSGADTTNQIFQTDNYILVMAKDFEYYDNWKTTINRLIQDAKVNHVPIFLVSADANTANKHFRTIEILKCDATVMKTAARVSPTVFLMQKAKILDKFSAHDQNRMNDAIALILGRKIN